MIKKHFQIIFIFSLVTFFYGEEIKIDKEIILEAENTETVSEENQNLDENNELEETTEITLNVQEDSVSENQTEISSVSEEFTEAKNQEATELAAAQEESENTTEEIIEELPKIAKKVLTLPDSDRPEVERFRQMYLEKIGTKQLYDAIENALNYRLYVRYSLEEKNLPPELEYLPVVESNYKIYAKSKSGAIGLWQFMENSVKPFLTLNDYVDERYDPWKSTDAALKKLLDNYNYFNDWLIAIGAYNCGTGAMSKALAKSPVKNFWYLAEHKYIPTQTALYVPKLIAIADLAINSEYYGIELPNHNEEYEMLHNEKYGLFDYVTVNKAYSLSQLAQEMRIDESLIKQLNPSYTKGFTHPSNESKIRLPLGMEKTALSALAKIKPIDFPVKYKVVSGDSLWSISRKYGTTVKAICELNGIDENDILRIGKILYIPSK